MTWLIVEKYTNFYGIYFKIPTVTLFYYRSQLSVVLHNFPSIQVITISQSPFYKIDLFLKLAYCTLRDKSFCHIHQPNFTQ